MGVIGGSLALSSAESQEVGDSPVVLVLQNLGSTVTIGLPPYDIQHDLTVTLSGNGLSVGAVVDGVTLADPPDPGIPEPGSGWLLAAGVALCWAAARRRVLSCARAESAVCPLLSSRPPDAA